MPKRRLRTSRALPGIGCSMLTVAVFGAQLALAGSPDGIDLTLTQSPPSVTLQWTGGTPTYRVYRSTAAPGVMDAANAVADTNANVYVDDPPAGRIHFYVVTAQCPAGTVSCGSTCVDTSIDSLNCGACWVACGTGASCVAGLCTCSGACANQPPVADAGADPSPLVDVDTDGAELVDLDGSASRDPDGGIVRYEWRKATSILAGGPDSTARVYLAVGSHTVTLTVTDDQGATDVDEVVIRISPGSSSDHPKLILRGSSFQAMRDRAATEPWASMMADAIATSDAGYVPGGDNSEIARNLTRFSSASALAYILDGASARVYAVRARDAILDHVDELTFGTDWGTVVPPAHALFNLTLALDVVYNHLTAAEVAACETKMEAKIAQVWTGDWSSAGLGAIGTWNVYTGAGTVPDDAYYDSLMSGLSLDGVFLGGKCYGWARWNGGNRYVKNMYMDVLEFTGVDGRYYDNPRIIGLYEWLYGHGEAVFGGPIPFGDCAIQPERGGAYDEPPLYRAEKFGRTAGRYAAVGLPAEIRGNLLSYVVPDGPLPPAAYATSKIYPDGGGFFMEAVASPAARPAAMGGILWNAMGYEGHSHYDVNAVAIAGYNEYLLVNSGYSGWGSGLPGYSWSWIHDDERSGNTLRTSSRHASKAGGGVVEGFTDTLFDYACGDDGPALPDDVHLRNLVFVHADVSSRPYFVLFDEVYADGGERILMNLHPNTLATTGIQTVVSGTEYTATINAVALEPNRAKLTVFYATPPGVVRHLNGGVATWSAPNGGFEGKYLESEYTAPAGGEKNVVTVLFPHDVDHVKAAMTRLSVTGSGGARIDHGSGVVDHAFESTGAAPVTYGGNTFTGRALLYREAAGGANVFYFVRKGTSFSTSVGPPAGFSSVGAVSVYLRGTRGRIVSPGTTVRFTYPQISGVKLDGSTVGVVGSGPDWVEVHVPGGTHGVELLTGG